MNTSKLLKTVFAIAIFLFTTNAYTQVKSSNKSQAQKSKNATVIVEQKVITEDAFLKKHTDVKSISWQPGAVVTLTKTNGTEETYHLDTRTDEVKFIEAYGQILRQAKPVKTQGN